MIFRQVLNADLGCASYFIADGGEAVVVDPGWEIEPYLALARAHRTTIRHVVDTHVHADHVSGRSRLVAATGATASLPPRTGASGPHDLIQDGGVLRVGEVEIAALATPGHRPEHLSFLVTDFGRSEEPCLLLSGDSLLVGDVARPDLATSGEEELGQAARALFGALRRLAALPDHIELWPGHIGGSLCAAVGVTGKISSTIGFERLTNPGLAALDEESFVSALLGRLPERPPTVDAVVALNRSADGPPASALAGLGPHHVRSLLADGSLVVDGRPSDAFDDESIPGSLSIPLEELGVGSRAAWFADPRDVIVVVADDAGQARLLADRLVAVGLQNIAGSLSRGLSSWRAEGFPVASTPRIEVPRLAELLREETVTLVDIRDEDEFDEAHVPGSLNLPWRELRLRSRELDSAAGPVVVACASGRRTAFAASVLSRGSGLSIARLVNGGINDLAAHGVPLARRVLAA